MFCIISGDIASDYSPVGNLLMDRNRPFILINQISLLDFEILHENTEIYFNWLRSIAAFLLSFIGVGYYWAIAIAFFLGIRTRHIRTFRMEILGHGTFTAMADEKSYQEFAKAILDSNTAI